MYFGGDKKFDEKKHPPSLHPPFSSQNFMIAGVKMGMPCTVTS